MYGYLLSFLNFYFQQHDKVGMWTTCWHRQSLWGPQSELSFGEGANEARAILWPLVPSMRINYPIQWGRIFFIHWFLQLSNNLDCLLHLIFHLRRRKCPHKKDPHCASHKLCIWFICGKPRRKTRFFIKHALKLSESLSTASFSQGKRSDLI